MANETSTLRIQELALAEMSAAARRERLHRELADRRKKTIEAIEKAAFEKASGGRNGLCACGSGRKFKKCHGK